MRPETTGDRMVDLTRRYGGTKVRGHQGMVVTSHRERIGVVVACPGVAIGRQSLPRGCNRPNS
jgi:hypothetical protein